MLSAESPNAINGVSEQRSARAKPVVLKSFHSFTFVLSTGEDAQLRWRRYPVQIVAYGSIRKAPVAGRVPAGRFVRQWIDARKRWHINAVRVEFALWASHRI